MPARPLTQPLTLAVLMALAVSGCVVSFDGYQLDESDGGIGGASGSGALGGSGGSSASGGAGGSSAAGGSTGGSAGSTGGSAGSTGGSAGSTGGSAGSTGGSAGSTGGSAGSTGGAGGNGGVGGSIGGTGGVGGTGGSSGSGNCPTWPGLPPMKKIPKPGGGEYCIDPTEISNEQYNLFISDTPSLGNQPQGCTTNSTYLPPTSFECQWDATNKPTLPVRCVDWCDAYAFCQHVGKRLCGTYGGQPTPLGGLTIHTDSEWFNACSEGGTQAYVFGNTYSQALWNTCNGLENSTGALDVGTKPQCQCSGAYAGVFDLNGNLREWENACNGSNLCASRGGGHNDSGDPGPNERMRCDSAELVPRLEQSEFRGFRCCADLI
jgi:hypothetical protein